MSFPRAILIHSFLLSFGLIIKEIYRMIMRDAKCTENPLFSLFVLHYSYPNSIEDDLLLLNPDDGKISRTLRVVENRLHPAVSNGILLTEE